MGVGRGWGWGAHLRKWPCTVMSRPQAVTCKSPIMCIIHSRGFRRPWCVCLRWLRPNLIITCPWSSDISVFHHPKHWIHWGEEVQHGLWHLLFHTGSARTNQHAENCFKMTPVQISLLCGGKSHYCPFKVFLFYMHHCPSQKMFEFEFLVWAWTAVSDLMSILLSHCPSQFSHHGCEEGHFWSLQWEEVGTVLYQGYGIGPPARSPASLRAESQKQFKNWRKVHEIFENLCQFVKSCLSGVLMVHLYSSKLWNQACVAWSRWSSVVPQDLTLMVQVG